MQTLHNYRIFCPGATFFRDGQVCEDCLNVGSLWPGALHGCYRDSKAQSALATAILCFHHWRGTWQDDVDLYIALTEFSRQKFITGGLPGEKIIVKPNFVVTDPGMGNHKDEYALFVGRLTQEKGVHTLLAAWRFLKKIPLLVLGDGPLEAEIFDRVSTNPLTDVTLLGRASRDVVFEKMKDARFLVFASEWYEGFPMTIVEAFACGLPVIASRLGAMAEIIEDGYSGLLFEPGNSEDLAAKVEWAWTHPEQMAEMGRNARHEYETKYTAEINYQKLMEIYQLAIENHRKR